MQSSKLLAIEASPAELRWARERRQHLAQLRANATERQRVAAQRAARPYHNDPSRWARECVRWRPGEEATAYQLGTLDALVDYRRVAVRGPHGLGKTAENALAVLWFALTRDAAGEDWKIPTTASAWRQLEKYLWPEIHKWARRLDWDRIGRAPFTRRELLNLSLKLATGEAFAVACEDPAKLEGAHADEMLFIFDEAKTIPAGTFDAAEGAFSGAGGDTASNAYALASSTPGAPEGRFYELHARKPGLEDWHAIHVTLEDTVSAGRVSREWAEQRARQWGEKSAVYANRVLGEFAASEEDGVIPLAHIELANERWLALNLENLPPLVTVGVDVARSGPDQTVLALRHGLVIKELKRYRKQGTMETAGQVAAILRAHHHPALSMSAIVDVIGIGAGVVDRLREQGFQVVAFNASEGSSRLDRARILGFVNCRAAAWWNLREMLDPDSGLEVALPPDDMLTGDLTAPTWKVMSGGRIQVEAKDDIRKRLGRSTDDGDAVVQAFWPEGGPQVSAPVWGAKPGPSRWKVD